MQRIVNTCWQLTVIVVLLMTSSELAVSAETNGWNSKKPQWWETERPTWEGEPGSNLYWHDPLLGSTELCREWPASINGCPPNWYGRGELMALWRDANDKRPFATLGPQGPVALSTSDLDREAGAGARVLLGKSLGPWYRVEASYFGAYTWSSDAAVRNLDTNDQAGVGNLYSPFSNFGDPAGIVGLDYNDFASIRLTSRLNNGELNLRRRLLMRPGSYEASFLMGARYMDITERFNYYSESATPGPAITSNAVDVHTSNKMIGFQIGLLSQFLFQPRCWVDFEMKGGVFQNQTSLERTYTISDVGGPATAFTGTDTRNGTSFVGDLSLQANYQFARHWTFFAGYNVMWVTGVALAPRNFTDSDALLVFGPTIVDNSGTVTYHGPNFGVVAAY